MEQKQNVFDGWAVVEVLGRQTYTGYVTTESYGSAVLFRVDVPALDARERETKSTEYDLEGRRLPPGTKVLEGPVEGYTKLVGAGSIYMITPCTKEFALKAVEETQRRPLLNVTLPAGVPALTVGQGPPDVDFEDIDRDDDGDDED